ncbi:IS110 family transposase [Sphingomonas sp. 37zxx]|uniref:IS110 family transposase n=1 Tax=Sphingomonas sp. 37zxx TaxID=1550073 RepID=UPI00053BF737|nr:IS110 family transposase [Sphingomonas sp. 37zxx]
MTANTIIIGVDTHKATHVAVAIDANGSRLACISAPATTKGYLTLESWASALGTIAAFGIEGTGSYGAGLSRHLLAQGHKVVEVTRPNRQLRYQHGKTDSIDAEGAARSVLAGQAAAEPKTQTGSVEMIRHLKIARDTAVKSRSQALVTLKTLIINAPASLRDALDQIGGKMALIRHIAAFRPGAITSTTAPAKTAMRALAQRWLALHDEVQGHDKALEHLVVARAPALIASHGIATMTAAEMLILVGDDPTRIRSEAALAKLCGVCPIPASSGKTNRFRLNRGGNRQANAALYRVAIVRMRNHQPTLAYVSKRKTDGKSNREIIRCLKRYIVREIFAHLCRPETTPTPA